jgi:hypothetical protein
MLRKILNFAISGILLLGVAANAAAKPVVIKNLDASATGPVFISDVSLEAAEGIWVNDKDRADILEKIKKRLDAQAPAGGRSAAGVSVYAMRLLFTRFDHGNGVARLALIGLGQIHMEALVSFLDIDGKLSGQYKVGKGLVLGGIAGGIISTSDIENGFATAVASIVSPKKTEAPAPTK